AVKGGETAGREIQIPLRKLLDRFSVFERPVASQLARLGQQLRNPSKPIALPPGSHEWRVSFRRDRRFLAVAGQRKADQALGTRSGEVHYTKAKDKVRSRNTQLWRRK